MPMEHFLSAGRVCQGICWPGNLLGHQDWTPEKTTGSWEGTGKSTEPIRAGRIPAHREDSRDCVRGRRRRLCSPGREWTLNRRRICPVQRVQRESARRRAGVPTGQRVSRLWDKSGIRHMCGKNSRGKRLVRLLVNIWMFLRRGSCADVPTGLYMQEQHLYTAVKAG